MTTAESLRELSLLLVSIAVLWKASDLLVGSAARVARRFGLSNLVIGMTIVAIGTSSPEMLVTLVAAFRDQPDISVGNVVGSNIFNTGIILGGCAAIWGMRTSVPLVNRNIPALLISVTLLVVFLHDLALERHEGAIMLGLLIAYVTYLLWRPSTEEVDDEEVPSGAPTRFDPLWVVLCLGAVLLGAHLLVGSASALAEAAGISEWVIGVTVVAGGTSLPELATAFAAARRGHTSMMAGGLVGSDLFNVLGVLGVAALSQPLTIDASATASLYMMTAMIALLWLFSRTGWRVTRAEGLFLVAIALARWANDLGPL